MSLFKTEPAVVIGLVASIIVVVAQQVLASGIVTSAGAIQWLNLIIALVPTIASIITRSQVTPVAAPAPTPFSPGA